MVSDGNNNVVRKYTWGLDLAGQMGTVASGVSAGRLDAGHGGPALQGAGGIGGLLAVSDPNDPNDPNDPCGDFVYFYDGNGNVGQVVDLAHDANDPAGALVAKYEYDPYGQRINHDPNVPEYDQPWRFSTKRFDAETGLYDFDLRLFSPGLGRWITRDPIHERGGLHLYAYVRNRPIDAIDPSGLMQESQAASRPCCFCGPNVTGWLQQELSTIDTWASQAIAEIQDAWPVGIDVPYWYSGRESARLNLIYQAAKQLTYYPTTTFKSSDCPKCDQCKATVTLCGMCIHTSEVGNLVYGYMAKALGFSGVMRDIGGRVGNRGEQTAQDKASVKAGYHLSPGDVCTHFKNNSAIAADIVKGANTCCNPCLSSVDSNANHIRLPPVVRRNVWSPYPNVPLTPLPPVEVPPEVR